jgi:hypothetical protein
MTDSNPTIDIDVTHAGNKNNQFDAMYAVTAEVCRRTDAESNA